MKFKNIKKNLPVGEKKTESPSNSRTIPDFAKASSDKPAYFKFSFPKIDPSKLVKLYRQILKVFIVVTFIAAVTAVGLDLQKNLQTKREIDLQRETLIKDLGFWEDFISKRQNYRDAYFQASILEYKLGNTSKAKMYVEKGLSLDPNSENGRKIEQLLR